jgi:hypothetical protein
MYRTRYPAGRGETVGLSVLNLGYGYGVQGQGQVELEGGKI